MEQLLEYFVKTMFIDKRKKSKNKIVKPKVGKKKNTRRVLSSDGKAKKKRIYNRKRRLEKKNSKMSDT